MTVTEDLVKLYQVDRQARGLRQRLTAAQRYLDGQQRQLADVNERLAELETRTMQLRAKIANLETEGAVLDERLEKFREDMNSAATNKQYTAVLTELNTVKEMRSKIDDSILIELEEVESLQGQIEELKAKRAEREKVRDVAAAQLKEREAEVGERLAEIETERSAAAAEIPGAELSIFDELANIYEGEAMAPVDEIDRRRREYACGECNMHLPFEQVANLMAPISGLARCPACGRILYLQEEVRGLVPK